jgi:peptidoglycan/xylan/chitin deacetylase (PgdA/CDA1 family)
VERGRIPVAEMRPTPESGPEAPVEASSAAGFATHEAHLGRPGGEALRARLRRWVRHGALSVAGGAARFGDRAFLRCLYAHWVLDDQVEDFRRLLSRLQRIGTFVSTDALVRMLRGEAAIEGHTFHLSFDDAFDNLYRNALPVLVELGIPAAVFAPTHFVGASDAEVRRDWWRRDQVTRPTRPLRWEWLEEMARHGCDIGSHTRRHRRLSEIESRDELADEIVGSKRDLEDRLGRPCRYFAWPYGRASDIDARGLALIAEAGYEASFSAVRGRVVPQRTRPLEIPRHHFEPDWPWPHVRFFAAGGLEGD